MLRRRKPPYSAHLTLLLLLLLSTTVTSRPFVLILSQDDLKDTSSSDTSDDQSSTADWDEFGESDSRSEEQLDPGSWRPVFEPNSDSDIAINPNLASYYSAVRKLVGVVSGDGTDMEDVASEIKSIAGTGDPHAQSLLGFLYGTGIARARNGAKGFMYHYFAADSGNTQSKLARAYTYYRQKQCVQQVACRIIRPV